MTFADGSSASDSLATRVKVQYLELLDPVPTLLLPHNRQTLAWIILPSAVGTH